jgi:ketosteroid isomerase-like protein
MPRNRRRDPASRRPTSRDRRRAAGGAWQRGVALGTFGVAGVAFWAALFAGMPAAGSTAVAAAAGSSAEPVREAGVDLAAERARLGETDRAFSRLSRQQGMRAAFLAYLAGDAVLFRPGPVPGRAFLEARPSPPIELIWAPIYSAVAASGDLGYTTGPYEVRDTGPDRALEEQGYYVTIWRKQADGGWKVAVDQGVATPPPVGADAAALGEAGEHAATGGSGAPAANATGAPANGAAQKAVLDADRHFAGDAGAHGARAAYMANLAPDARLYRAGVLPAVGRDAVGRALAAGRQGASSWQPTAAAASAAGDLGYTYGDTALMAPGVPGRIQQAAMYLRLWQRQRDGTYRIVLDLVKALPQPAPAPPATPAPPAPQPPPAP